MTLIGLPSSAAVGVNVGPGGLAEEGAAGEPAVLVGPGRGPRPGAGTQLDADLRRTGDRRGRGVGEHSVGDRVGGGLVAEPVWEPDLVAVTLARRRWPSCAAVGLNDLVVAPEIGLPLASHW